jgi:AcrR family transcriptional regulator
MAASRARGKTEAMTIAAGSAAQAPRPSTRDLILTASGELFNMEGFEGTSIAMICERVDIMAGNLTYYFPKKRDIVLALKDAFDKEISQLQTELLSDLLDGTKVPSPAESHRLLRSMLEIVWNYRFFFTSMMSLHRLDSGLVEAFRKVEQQARMGLSQIVQRGVNEQSINPLRYPNSPSALADNIWYLMWGCMFFQKARDRDLEPEKAEVMNTCLLQLGAVIEPLVSAEFMAEYCVEVSRGR